MTGAEHEEELAAIRRSNERWRGTVVEALTAVIARLDAECRQLEEKLSDATVEESLFLRARDERTAANVLSNAHQARIDELERELRVVKRDRDALVQRAETAERTLQNQGYDLRTMRRGGSQSPPSGPTSGPAGTIGFPPSYGRGFEK